MFETESSADFGQITQEKASERVTLTAAGERELDKYQRGLALIDELHNAPRLLLADLPANVRAQLRVEAARLVASVQELDALEARQ